MSNDNYEKALEYYNNGDYDKAIYWYNKGINEKDVRCSSGYAHMLFNGIGMKKDEEKARQIFASIIDELKSFAESGDCIAQKLLGNIYLCGHVGRQDYEKAVYWYEKAANQGDVDSQCRLSYMYYLGEGVQEDFTKAAYWGQKAAEQGDVSAQFLFGYICYCGDGVEKDLNRAFYWYEKASKQGDSSSKLFLALMFYKGESVEQDYNKAFELFNEATRQEYCPKDAYFYLAECYYNGYGVKANWQKAKEYYQRAIDNGYNCRYSLEMVKRDLREYDDSNGIRVYADSVIEKKLFAPDVLALIKKDLENDFGEYWAQLKDNSQTALISGVFSYINFYSLGEEIYKSLDFTPCITAMAKALETELAEFFFKHYLAFLKRKGASPTEFSENQCFINVTQDGEEEIYSFVNNDETYRFSLGSLWYIIEVKTELPTDIESVGRSPSYRKKGRGITTISKYAIEFANELFKEDAFSENNREKEIVNYLIDLATDVKDIKKIRNPAAHSDTMTCAQAEVCGDYLIKVRKLICNILSKIKDEYK